MVRFMRYSKVFRLYEAIQPLLQYSPPVEKAFPGKKVLAIAPHPDDESVGCGGSLAAHAAAGGIVEILYCTSDGQPRDGEAQRAAGVLGASHAASLGYAVGTLESQKELPKKLAEALDERKPDVMCVPFVIDNHADHRALNLALIEAAKIRKFDMMVYAYPVWLPLYPNVLIDIGGTWEKKKEAIACYASQTATRDYAAMAGSLAQYWAAVKGRELTHAESFYRASFGEYVLLAGKIFVSGDARS